MTSHAFGLIELILVFGIVIGWALWELWTLRRARRKPPDRPESER